MSSNIQELVIDTNQLLNTLDRVQSMDFYSNYDYYIEFETHYDIRNHNEFMFKYVYEYIDTKDPRLTFTCNGTISTFSFPIFNKEYYGDIKFNKEILECSSGLCFMSPEHFEFIRQSFLRIIKKRLNNALKTIMSGNFINSVIDIDVIPINNKFEFYFFEKSRNLPLGEYVSYVLDQRLITNGNNNDVTIPFYILIRIDKNKLKMIKLLCDDFHIIEQSELKDYRNNKQQFYKDYFIDYFYGGIFEMDEEYFKLC